MGDVNQFKWIKNNILRFTPSAIWYLFPDFDFDFDFDFDLFPTSVSSNKDELFTPLPQKFSAPQVNNSKVLKNWRRGQEVPYLLATMINMIEQKKDEGVKP